MTDLNVAVSALKGHSLALCKDGKVITSDKRGVLPWLNFLEENVNLNGYSVADAVVGKAAAMFMVKAGVIAVHAVVISEKGKAFLEKNGIKPEYETLVPAIINRDKSGFCPMETAVENVSDAEEGALIIKKKLQEIRNPVKFN